MHGRTRLLILALAALMVPPAAAVASPMPAGTYDVALTGGSVQIGSGLVPALTVNAIGSFPVDIGTQPVTNSLPLVVADGPITGTSSIYTLTGTAKTTVVSASTMINPADGSATIDASVYASIDLTATALGVPTSGSCSFGSADQPVAIHMTTAQGAAWDATTGAFSLADRSFALPAPSCSVPLLGSLIGVVTGSTGSGSNSATTNGQATRRADTTPPPPPPQQQPGGPVVIPENTGQTNGTGAAACVVPKLVGKKLAAAKKALRVAGCKAGKVKSKASTKKKSKGRVIAQSRKPGTKLPVGSAVGLTLARSHSRAHKHR